MKKKGRIILDKNFTPYDEVKKEKKSEFIPRIKNKMPKKYIIDSYYWRTKRFGF